MPIIVPDEIKTSFFSKTERRIINEIEHHIWIRCRDKDGYGLFTWRCKSYRAHRFSWLIEHGEWPKNLCLHKNICHITSCIMIDHLYDGNIKDNARDSIELGTHPWHDPLWGSRVSEFLRGHKCSEETLRKMSVAQRGENHPSVKLTETKVLLIRKLASQGVLGSILADDFGVSRATICNIVKRVTWRHI